jgi:protein-S-isoprenylcysteine O-methyltransferase Ste14
MYPVQEPFLFRKHDGRMNYYYIDVIVWVILACLAVFRWDRSAYSTIALLVACACFMLWIAARLQLGTSFRIRAEAHKLVTHGLYRKIRNPIYTFAFGAFLGVLAALRTWAGIVVFLVFYSTQLIRIRREEKVLEEAFGDEYRAYRKQTWF